MLLTGNLADQTSHFAIAFWARLNLVDLLVALLCLLLSALVYIINNEENKEDCEAHTVRNCEAHVFQCKTYHARFTPSKSGHRFEYPTVNVGVDLGQLENGKFNIPGFFNYWPQKRSNWSLWAIHPRGYLDDYLLKASGVQTTAKSSILGRLKQILVKNGCSANQISHVYMVSMPSCLGFEGINPLVVHYCYKEEVETNKRRLSIVVLEVHNTFGERHVYILQVGVEEDVRQSDSFDHQWTFPRAFHVSPFNDRSGYYKVKVVDPFRTTKTKPYMHVHITMLDSDQTTKKLVASLYGSGQPLMRSSIIRTTIKFPLELFLTTPRILAQAGALHWRRKLDVFPRPEPLTTATDEGAKPGSVYRQSTTFTDRVMQKHALRCIQRSVDNLQRSGRSYSVHFVLPEITVKVSPMDKVDNIEIIVVESSTPAIFSMLCVTRDLELVKHQARAVAVVTNTKAFQQILENVELEATPLDRLCAIITNAYFRWSVGTRNWPRVEQRFRKPSIFDRQTSLSYLFAFVATAISDVLGYTIYKAIHARFVTGKNPWEVWQDFKS